MNRLPWRPAGELGTLQQLAEVARYRCPTCAYSWLERKAETVACPLCDGTVRAEVAEP